MSSHPDGCMSSYPASVGTKMGGGGGEGGEVCVNPASQDGN